MGDRSSSSRKDSPPKDEDASGRRSGSMSERSASSAAAREGREEMARRRNARREREHLSGGRVTVARQMEENEKTIQELERRVSELTAELEAPSPTLSGGSSARNDEKGSGRGTHRERKDDSEGSTGTGRGSALKWMLGMRGTALRWIRALNSVVIILKTSWRRMCFHPFVIYMPFVLYPLYILYPTER